MFCPKCGTEYEEGAQFCKKCGEPNPLAAHAPMEKNNGDKQPQGVTKGVPVKSSKKPSPKAILIILAAIAIIAVGIGMLVSGGNNPRKVKEVGTFDMEMEEETYLPSIDTTVKFGYATPRSIDYDAISAELLFFIEVYVPDPEQFKPYINWLNSFEINGEPVTCDSTATLSNAEKVYRTDCVYYVVSCLATPDKQDYLVTCKANKNLNFEFHYHCPFWDLEGIDKLEAIAYNQGKLDGAEIQIADWSADSDATGKDYIEGNEYLLTGTVLDCGPYFSNDKFYIILDSEKSFPGWDVHCYFDKQNWKDISWVKPGDTVQFFGAFEFKSFGWNFTDCFVYSPSGKTFVVHEDGTTEIVESGEAQHEPEPEIPSEAAPSTSIDSQFLLSSMEGEYHMAHSYFMAMYLQFNQDVTGMNFTSWTGSEPLEMNVNFIVDDSDIIGTGTIYIVKSGNHGLSLSGYLDGSEDENDGQFTITYDGDSYYVNCPQLEIYDAQFFED